MFYVKKTGIDENWCQTTNMIFLFATFATMFCVQRCVTESSASTATGVWKIGDKKTIPGMNMQSCIQLASTCFNKKVLSLYIALLSSFQKWNGHAWEMPKNKIRSQCSS